MRKRKKQVQQAIPQPQMFRITCAMTERVLAVVEAYDSQHALARYTMMRKASGIRAPVIGGDTMRVEPHDNSDGLIAPFYSDVLCSTHEAAAGPVH